MTVYLFKRIDVHYIEVEADSEEQAKTEVRHVSCMEDGVETYQGEWNMEEKKA